MKIDWYRGISKSQDPEAYAERADLVRSARPTLELLKGMVEDRLAELKRQQMNQENYELAAWPFLQADLLGGMRELERLKEILTIEKSK